MSIALAYWIMGVAQGMLWAIVIFRLLAGKIKGFLAGSGDRGGREDRGGRGGQIKKSAGFGKKKWAWVTFWLFAVSMLAYYLVLAGWFVDPGWAGVLLLPSSAGTGTAGIFFIVIGISLVSWAYLRLHSFKLLATINSSHQLCIEGPYSIIRHPVYAGIDLFYLGCFLVAPRFGFLISSLGIVISGYLRGMIEEQALSQAFGARYDSYRSKTYRYIPWVF